MPAKKKPRPAARKSRSTVTADRSLNFAALVDSIRQVHEHCAASVNRTINTTLTLRNWAIGPYIREYEQNGADRAKYGNALIERLAERLMGEGLERMEERELRRYRLFYMTYPGIRESATPEFVPLLPAPIWRSLTAKSETRKVSRTAGEAVTGIREPVTPELAVPLRRLFTSLSFTHLAELIAIDDPFPRNEMVAALADDAYVAHVSSGGQTERIIKKLEQWGIPRL